MSHFAPFIISTLVLVMKMANTEKLFLSCLHREDDETCCQDPSGVIPLPDGFGFDPVPPGGVIPGEVKKLPTLTQVAALHRHGGDELT